MPIRNPSVNWDSALRLDDAESAFFLRELEFIKTVTYDIKYRPLKALTLFPIESEANTGATQITWRQFAMVGTAKIIADYANDFPAVDVYAQEVVTNIKSIGDKYGYSIQEIRQSQFSGKRLDQRRAGAARRAIDQVIHLIAINGDGPSGLNGFFSWPGITQYVVPADGVGGSATWASKTGDQIVRDVTGVVNAVVATTAGVEEPDHLIIPVNQYVYIASTRLTQFTDRTILEFLLMSSPFIKKVVWIPELSTAGSGATAQMMCWPNDNEHVTLQIPQPFEQFDPQQKGMQFDVPCHARTCGLLVYYPLSISYGYGI